MPYGRFTYRVSGHRIVPAGYREAFKNVPGAGERLVLSACHPLYNATHPILVEPKLVRSQPLGAAIAATPPPAQLSPAEIAHRRYVARLKALGHGPLGPGVSGPAVRELQRLLGMPVTGLFDPNTTAAVVAFQHDHGLPQVGIVGRKTKVALARRTRPPPPPPHATAVATADSRAGASAAYEVRTHALTRECTEKRPLIGP